MSVDLRRDDLNALAEVIAFMEGMDDSQSRRNLLTPAFADYPKSKRMLSRINYSGNAETFTISMITYLANFGQIEQGIESLGVLLKHIADPNLQLVDWEDSAFLEKLIIGYEMFPDVTPKEALASASETLSETQPSPDESATPNEGCYVFISYARPDVDTARAVGAELQKKGIPYFQDIKDIKFGNMWSQVIEEGLRKATHMILLLSKASMPERKEVEREWFYFDMKKRPILTLLVEECDINSRLIQINYADATKDSQSAIQNLVAQIKSECS